MASYFPLSSKFNSVLDLNITTVSGELITQKSYIKFGLIGITYAFRMIAYTVLLLSVTKLFLTFTNNKFAKIKS
jgi:hypothetical protein